MTPLEQLLLGGIGTALCGIGAMVAGMIRTDVRKMREAVELIPEAIGEFKIALVGVETRTLAKLDAHGQLLANQGKAIDGLRDDVNRRLSSAEDALHSTAIEVVRATGASVPDLSGAVESSGPRLRSDPEELRREPTGKHRAVR